MPQNQRALPQRPASHSHNPLNLTATTSKLQLELDKESTSNLIKMLNQHCSLGSLPDSKSIHRSALKELQRLLHHSTKPSYYSLSLRESLPVYAALFDDLLFGRALRGTYKLVFDESKEIKKNSISAGYMVREKGTSYCKITIVEAQVLKKQRSLGEESGWRYGLDVLLHEMTHAFLELYGCKRGQCGEIRTELMRIGVTGHGAVWVEVATLAEWVMTQRVGIKMSLDRMGSFAAEVIESRVGRKSNGDLAWNRGWNDPKNERGIPFERFSQWGFSRSKFVEHLGHAIKRFEGFRASGFKGSWYEWTSGQR